MNGADLQAENYFWHGIFDLYPVQKTKNTKKIFVAAIAIAVITTLTFIGCRKSQTGYKLDVHLTDAPAAFEEVNVDIEEVKVKLRDDADGWVSLNTNAGIYNLLGLQNGVDTLLATGIIPSNFVQEIRLYLGSDNTVKVGGQLFPLSMNSGDAERLMIKVNKSISDAVDSLIIDFDAGLSITLQGDGSYRLQPVITIK